MLASVKVESISKIYRIRGSRQRYHTLRESLSQGFSRLGRTVLGRARREETASQTTEWLWALRDVNLEVAPGEVVGIIGKNGAGKSTLLKVLGRITEPTSGRAVIRGRVGSLLEVGTGFHPELTGRENIFLSGALLGMRKNEVTRVLDEIVAFAEVERFLDMPVKHYSSGMYLRLAFAVASHLNAEILLVDEVLAVGDARFQKRCLGKMNTVAKSGRTVLFVSHNLGALRDLCPRSILIDQGQVRMDGETSEVIRAYSSLLSDNTEEEPRTYWSRIEASFHPRDSSQGTQQEAPELLLSAHLRTWDPLRSGYLVATVDDAFGRTILNRRINLEEIAPELLKVGHHTVEARFSDVWFPPGAYVAYFKLLASTDAGGDVRMISDRAYFDVSGKSDGLGKSTWAPPCRWAFRSEKDSAENPSRT